jgi:lipoate-protein ligase A
MIPVLNIPPPLKKNDDMFMACSSARLPQIRSYAQISTEVVHGPSCVNTDIEIELARCAENRVPVLARRGGGGTVVLSKGMIITVIVGRRSEGDNARSIFSKIHRVIISLLSPYLNAQIDEKGISDLAILNKKILGSSLYMPGRTELFCYQSSLMVDSDLSLLDKYLKHPPREPDYRLGRTHAEFCANLRQFGYELSATETANLINSMPGLT